MEFNSDTVEKIATGCVIRRMLDDIGPMSGMPITHIGPGN